MLCANILPGHAVETPPAHLCQLLPLDEMLDAENDDGDVDSFEEDSDGDEAEPSGIPECSLQVITNAVRVFFYSGGGRLLIHLARWCCIIRG